MQVTKCDSEISRDFSNQYDLTETNNLHNILSELACSWYAPEMHPVTIFS